VDYYDALSTPMIRALEGRPAALEHWNEGIDEASWYQQDISRDEEPWMTIVEAPLRSEPGRAARHLVVDRPETLRWLAQRSVITIHAWSSRVGALESPDWVIIDLDPAKGEGIAQAVEAARVFRRLLDEMEIPSLPKTSGKRGIHILIPLAPGHSYRQTSAFAERICSAVASRVDFITVERAIDRRKGRLYADALQNAYGKTIVAPYSPRGVDGAPVSAPLRWSEVTKRLDPLRFSIRTMGKRIDKVGDLFEDALQLAVSLPSLR
jgi:bifunctional non-homologous end joining protein LigD